MIYLMLHDDWEIYGDGTGDPEKLMFEPARRILDICDKYGAKYTFYAEIGQQMSMLNCPEKGWQLVAHRWEEILKDAVKRGHDVQLHLHPQWIGAPLVNDQWKLNYSKWNTGKLEFEEINEWIDRGAAYLRKLFSSVSNNYNLLSFRTGGWMCQPSDRLYRALKSSNIFCDVSVMKGRYKKYEDGGFVDFRDAQSSFEPWEVAPEDFARRQEGSGLWELPVYTETSKLPHYLYLLTRSFAPVYYYRIHNKRKQKKDVRSYSPRVVDSGAAKDYYGSFGYMHSKHLISYVNKVRESRTKGSKSNHLIFLTHSKSFLDYNNFDRVLSSLSNMQDVTFIGTGDYIITFLLA